MGYDFSELGISASVGVSGTILVLSSMMILSAVKSHLNCWNFPDLQTKVIIILFTPLVQGWLSWSCFFSPLLAGAFNFVIAIYISLVFLNFYQLVQLLVIKQLGYRGTDQNVMNIIAELFQRYPRVQCKLKCCGSFNTSTFEKALWYQKYINTAVYQNMIVLITLGAVEGVLKYVDSDQMDPQHQSASTAIFWFGMVKILSTVFAMMNILTWIAALNRFDELKGLQLADKAFVIQLGVMVPAAQGIFINIFTAQGLIANSEYSNYEIQVFTQSLLVCCEMIILSFAQHLCYPISDYKEGIMDKEKIND